MARWATGPYPPMPTEEMPSPGVFGEGIGADAEGGIRTRMGRPTRPSSVRVYQFHHLGPTVKKRAGHRDMGPPQVGLYSKPPYAGQ